MNQCFACWSELEKVNEAILFSPASEVSSDNVQERQAFDLCKECYNGILEFTMGRESPNYEKGNPTLQDFLEKTKGNDCKDRDQIAKLSRMQKEGKL